MKAKYRTPEGEWHVFEHPVVIPQESDQGGFTLIGFKGWQELTEQKMCAAVTGIIEFEVEDGKVGFGN